jgi:hypothetical protein
VSLNRLTLFILGCILVVAGTGAFLVPGVGNLTSIAPLYNAFHIIFGLTAFGFLLSNRERCISGFNFVFGMFDVYQFFANRFDLFPQKYFAWKPADDWLHVTLGSALVIIGYLGFLRKPTRAKVID